ncbi:hypothetical protein [Microbacterium sp. No. 7]|uniref:hypothetical protein n=1 Tax=Microbacterium sp. No. 7 TaxID=1714373 RepID=UPI000ADEC177|nr:hypothetical protein [Microbacterium sp. No. 7]
MAALLTPTAARSALALAYRYKRSPDVIAARRFDLAEAKIAASARAILRDLPPLTSEQRDRLAAAVRGDTR